MAVYERLDEHQANKGFPQTDSVTHERASILAGNADELVITLLLAEVENRVHSGAPICGASRKPLVIGLLVAAEELVQSPSVNVEGASLVLGVQ